MLLPDNYKISDFQKSCCGNKTLMWLSQLGPYNFYSLCDIMEAPGRETQSSYY